MADDFEYDEDLEIDFRRLKDDHLKAGYKVGLESGEESALQQGFNEGFADSVSIGQATSKLLGSISAVLCYLNSKKIQNHSEVKKQLLTIRGDVEQLEQKYLKDYEELVAFPNDSGVKMAESCSTENVKSGGRCCGNNAKEDGLGCCSEENDCENGQQINCCSQNTEASLAIKDKTKRLLDTLHKEVETIEERLTVLIEKHVLHS